MTLAADRRWQRFTDTTYRCPCCDNPVQGMLDVGYDHPDRWQHVSYRKNGGTVAVGLDVLTADFCSINETYHIRGLLSIPIKGADASFAFGPWARVPAETFRAYYSAFGTEAEATLGPCSGHLANELPGFEGSSELALSIRFLGGPDRPQFSIAVPSALSEAQTAGMSFDKLLDIYAAFGHDLRPHLGEA